MHKHARYASRFSAQSTRIFVLRSSTETSFILYTWHRVKFHSAQSIAGWYFENPTIKTDLHNNNRHVILHINIDGTVCVCVCACVFGACVIFTLLLNLSLSKTHVRIMTIVEQMIRQLCCSKWESHLGGNHHNFGEHMYSYRGYTDTDRFNIY